MVPRFGGHIHSQVHADHMQRVLYSASVSLPCPGSERCFMSHAQEPNTSLEAAFQTDCRALAVQVTSGVDQQRAESIEALTLLQLVQGIDVAVRLPYEALMQACPGIPDGSMLQQLRLESIPTPSSTATRQEEGFCALLMVDEDWYSCRQPFEAIGLALRYKAPIFMEERLFQRRSLSSSDCRTEFPEALPVEESAKQAHGITHNICVAWRAGATPIGDGDIAELRKQLGSK
mmetsp:Transcript_3143/g.8920  ORF Transcript_3143/g.8920 Transcript_3143/m.8920 type:complete len:232 (+) Transcript_3143:849-1544(+)